ncbi:MAG: heavy metal translocating P-type ATPase [Sphaerochaeta sp.]|nr:heavy metal translocating P-type ATPase [Sphaerochaeta sp.]
MKNENFSISGMTCSACSTHVDKAVKTIPGVKEVQVNLLQNTMKVEYDEQATDTQVIIDAVLKSGYGASVEGTEKDLPKKTKDDFLERKTQLIQSVSLLVLLSYLTMGKMLHLPIPRIFANDENLAVNLLTQLLLTITILIINRHYFIQGFRTLLHRRPTMDSLVAVGATASFLYSLWNIYLVLYHLGRGDLTQALGYSHNLYLDGAAMIVVFISIGKLMEARSKGKTTEAIDKLMNLAPKKVTIIRNGSEKLVDISAVLAGDIIILKTGESIAVDGILGEGSVSVDESSITGESLPVDKKTGDSLISGTMVKSGYCRYEATKVGKDTTLQGIINLVTEAGASKAPIARLADTIAGVFVPVVMLLALGVFIIWIVSGAEFSFALTMAISVLVVSCPCALGLATPTAIMVGTGRGAQLGILIKNAKSLEQLAKVHTVVLDKTGTITEGKPVIEETLTTGIYSAEQLLHLAASLEKYSEHPLSLAIVNHAKAQGIALSEAKGFTAIPGEGILGVVQTIQVCVGNGRMLEKHGIFLSSSLSKQVETLAQMGGTILFVLTDEKLAGLFAIRDKVKEDSKESIMKLKKMGLRTIMLTGDSLLNAKGIADGLDIDEFHAGVLPGDKQKIIQDLQKSGMKVAMVGDGINDSPSLVTADVGIAIGAGTEIAIDSADIVLIHSKLSDVVNAIALSKATLRNIKENLFWALGYNVFGIPLAAGAFFSLWGWHLNPMIASAMMSCSSIIVVSNALRLRFFMTRANQKKSDSITRHVAGYGLNIPSEENKMTKELMIEGMMCEHCQARVQSTLNSLEGVQAIVSFKDKKAVCTIDHIIRDDVLKEAIAEVGYKVVGIK